MNTFSMTQSNGLWEMKSTRTFYSRDVKLMPKLGHYVKSEGLLTNIDYIWDLQLSPLI